MEEQDRAAMRHALALARRGEGRTWPNPSVGCLLVKDGQVVAAAHTAPGGRPHAETQALTLAGERARGVTAYVTLEPCAHHGATPPCAEALIRAGVARAVIGCLDPDPRASGQGVALLKQAAMEVAVGVAEEEIAPLYAGYFRRAREGLPETHAKIATSRDGKIAAAPGARTEITGEAARRWTHSLRARHDVLLTGIGTVLADDPLLTCRLPGMEAASPTRAVMDTRLRIPLASKLVATAGEVPLWIFCAEEALEKEREKAERLRARGVEILAPLPSSSFQAPTLDIAGVLRALAARGATRVLVEAGQRLTSSALASGHVSRLYWLRAPMTLGEGGTPAFTEDVPLAEVLARRRGETQALGLDMLDVYEMGFMRLSSPVDAGSARPAAG